MAKREQIEEKIADLEYVEKMTNDYLQEKEIVTLKFSKNGSPENYVRERYTSRGNRFYNKKGGLMKIDQQYYMKQIPNTLKSRLTKLVVSKTSDYYVKINVDFYVSIQKNESIKRSVLKEKKIILPAIRPDIDNFEKYLVDVLHNIVFDDDKRVISLDANKYYSMNPRTEFEVEITIIKE